MSTGTSADDARRSSLWPATVAPDNAVLIFDGECNFCNRSVQTVLRHERAPRLLFAAAQSATGAALLAHFAISTLDSVVLVEGGQAHRKSAAALRLLKYLRLPWQVLRLGWAVPNGVRDWLYDAFAARRYAWFGRSEACMIPSPDVARRFLP